MHISVTHKNTNDLPMIKSNQNSLCHHNDNIVLSTEKQWAADFCDSVNDVCKNPGRERSQT